MWLVRILIFILYYGQTHTSQMQCKTQTIIFQQASTNDQYLVMRECENIPTWISLSGDLAFSQDGIYGFKFPKRFSELS